MFTHQKKKTHILNIICHQNSISGRLHIIWMPGDRGPEAARQFFFWIPALDPACRKDIRCGSVAILHPPRHTACIVHAGFFLGRSALNRRSDPVPSLEVTPPPRRTDDSDPPDAFSGAGDPGSAVFAKTGTASPPVRAPVRVRPPPCRSADTAHAHRRFFMSRGGGGG